MKVDCFRTQVCCGCGTLSKVTVFQAVALNSRLLQSCGISTLHKLQGLSQQGQTVLESCQASRWSVKTMTQTESIKPLFTCCDTISNRTNRKGGKGVSFHAYDGPFFPRAQHEAKDKWQASQIGGKEKIPEQKAPAVFWTQGLGGGREGRARRGKVLSRSG